MMVSDENLSGAPKSYSNQGLFSKLVWKKTAVGTPPQRLATGSQSANTELVVQCLPCARFVFDKTPNTIAVAAIKLTASATKTIEATATSRADAGAVSLGSVGSPGDSLAVFATASVLIPRRIAHRKGAGCTPGETLPSRRLEAKKALQWLAPRARWVIRPR